MPDDIFFSVPCKPDINLRLKKEKLTFYNEYCGQNSLTAKTIAQIGFDICECIGSTQDNIATVFKQISGIGLNEDALTMSKYAPVEAKVFGIINENTAVYSLGVLLRDLLISTGRNDYRFRAILDKACDRYPFMRYNSFCEFREDLAIYLKSEVDEEIYGVVITADKPLPQPIFAHTKIRAEKDEAVNFKPYTKTQQIHHRLAKSITLPRIQAVLAAAFILFSSISIPMTSARKSHNIPTLTYTEARHE